MKTLSAIILSFIVNFLLNAQDITNTLAPNGSFKIKDGTTDYFILNQSDGTIILPANSPGILQGSIFKGSDRFLHTYHGPGTDGFNTFLGINAGNFIMGGSNAFEGSYNTGVGFQSLSSLTTGNRNTANGCWALYSNETGNYNTALGSQAGSGTINGSFNIAIGYGAQVPDNTGSYQVRIGNSSITYAGIQVAWTITSDRRWKENIKPTNLGLDFISQLNPVSYTRKNDESHKTEYGLIAQEVEEVLKEYGVDRTGMLTITEDGMYELRYNDLIAPMVKAIQELSEGLKSEKLKTESS